MADVTLEALLEEGRTFPASAEFRANALVTDGALAERAAADPEAFWAEQARELLDWETDFTSVCDWELPVRPVVRRRASQRVGQLPRPPCSRRSRRPAGDPVGR